MSIKHTLLNTDQKWYVAQYNDHGDFAKMHGPYDSLEGANKAHKIPESTPAGENVTDKEVVESLDEKTARESAEKAPSDPAVGSASDAEGENTPSGETTEGETGADEEETDEESEEGKTESEQTVEAKAPAKKKASK